MASRRFVFVALLATGCAEGMPRFPMRPPLTRDADLDPIAYPCRPDPKKPGRQVCAPGEHESFVYWDLADKSVFRPAARFFAVRPGGESVNVNSLDEVPDSSWFENRAGTRPLRPDERSSGPCLGQKLLPEPAPRAWPIDQGKSDGVTPGFRVDIEGAGKFLLKADRLATPYRASTAEVVGSRLYWAAGFHTPCNVIAAIDPKTVRLEPGLVATSELGLETPFDDKALAAIFAQTTPLEDGRRRMGVSRWLPGRPLGPFTYDGTRDDDPLDVVPHEDRRELRGARLMAAWLGHYDAREQNTMATWMSSTPDPAASPGYVKHWYLDFGDSLGTKTKLEELSRRYGHTYLFDPGDIFLDFVTLGIPTRPWERQTSPNATFPYFTVEGFEPEAWKPGYPNPAFSRMTEADGAWMARIIASIDDDVIVAAVEASQLPPGDAAYLIRTLIGRRNAITRRYLARLSPIGALHVDGDAVCGIDFARRAGVFRDDAFHYAAALGEGERPPTTAIAVRRTGSDRICVNVPPSAGRMRVRIWNGQAPRALDVHLARDGALHLLGVQRR